MGKFIIAIAFMLAFVGQISANETRAYPEWEKEQVAGMVPVHGLYRNMQYGFGIPPVPSKTFQSAAPNPNHGVLILLGNQRTISISAEYDAAEYGSTKSELDHWLEGEHPDSVARGFFTLAGKPAEQAILQTGQLITKVIAQRRDERGGILYELTLNTTKTYQAEDMAAFDGIVGAFKTYPLPK